jgi:hypothetical protein
MSLPRALAYIGLWIALTAYFVVFESESDPVFDTMPARAPLLDGTPDELTVIELRKGNRTLRCVMQEDQWQVVAPSDGKVPSDLIAALVTNLVEAGTVEAVSEDGGRAEEFGLDQPQASIQLSGADGSVVTIQLGSRNPARTAVYARRQDAPRIMLIGLNVAYYLDLAMEAAFGAQPASGIPG